MSGAGEHVHSQGAAHAPALFPKTGDIPGQGARVAGDVDHPPGRHAHDGVYYRGGKAFAGRVHADHIRTHALRLQAQGGLSRIGAQKAGVSHPVAPGVFHRVLNGRAHHLGAIDQLGPAGQDQADGPDAAVQVQYSLFPGQARQLQDAVVKDLGLA